MNSDLKSVGSKHPALLRNCCQFEEAVKKESKMISQLQTYNNDKTVFQTGYPAKIYFMDTDASFSTENH